MRANPTAHDLRRINRRTVLRTMFADEPISRLELSQRSGLSTGTVTNVISELLAEGLVLESGFEASEGGRRRILLTFNQDYGYLLGGEVGETNIGIELFDLTLHKIKAVRYPLVSEQNTPEQVASRVVEGVRFLLNETGVPGEKILGLGLGLPGIIEHTDNELVFAPDWGWEPVPWKAMLREHLPFPVYLDNGSKIMALAEMRSNPGSQNETVAAVQIGTGVSAGVIYQGKLYRGATNSAGEWGHTVIEIDGKTCRCGRQGCLEAYIGAPGIMRHLRELDATSPFLVPGDEVAVMTALIEAAQQNHPMARQVIQDTYRYLGAGLANLINLFNPQRIIIGGWLGLQLGAVAFPELCRLIGRYALKQPFEVAEISLSKLGRDGVSTGGALLVLEDFFEDVRGLKNRVPASSALLSS
jgi:predicted NBD/HSP70 family sugar kinase